MADIFAVNETMKILEKSLEGLSKRQKVISNNIANADTPGFKRSDVSFENTLKSMITAYPQTQELPMKVTNAKHIISSANLVNPLFLVTSDNSSSYRVDGNNVDIEREMTEMNKNSTTHAAVAGVTGKEFSFIRDAIDAK